MFNFLKVQLFNVSFYNDHLSCPRPWRTPELPRFSPTISSTRSRGRMFAVVKSEVRRAGSLGCTGAGHGRGVRDVGWRGSPPLREGHRRQHPAASTAGPRRLCGLYKVPKPRVQNIGGQGARTQVPAVGESRLGMWMSGKSRSSQICRLRSSQVLPQNERACVGGTVQSFNQRRWCWGTWVPQSLSC